MDMKKMNLIYKREGLRVKLQIENLDKLFENLKDDIDLKRGLGLSLPAIENQMGKIGATCRKIQKMMTEDQKYEFDETDQETTLDQIEEQIDQIGQELGDGFLRIKEIEDIDNPGKEFVVDWSMSVVAMLKKDLDYKGSYVLRKLLKKEKRQKIRKAIQEILESRGCNLDMFESA